MVWGSKLQNSLADNYGNSIGNSAKEKCDNGNPKPTGNPENNDTNPKTKNSGKQFISCIFIKRKMGGCKHNNQRPNCGCRSQNTKSFRAYFENVLRINGKQRNCPAKENGKHIECDCT